MASRDDKNILAFGRNVRKFRQQEGISQAQLAYEAGLPSNTIARIERGEMNTSVSNVFRIAAALNIEPGELFKAK
jgi:transcriptional regulator with XRE-family HTH domain